MLSISKSAKDLAQDITYYAKDSRLTEPSDGKRYRWQDLLSYFKELGRPLTEEKAEKFRVH